MAWFLDQSFLQRLSGQKGFRQFHFTTCAILVLLMKQGILILCLKVRASPWGNAPCRSFLRFIHGPTDESLRTSSSRVAGASCSHSTCVVLPDFRYLQVSERSQRGSLVFFFHSPCCFGVVVSQTRSGECQVYTLLCTIWKFSVGVTLYYNQEYCHLTTFTSVFSLVYAVHVLLLLLSHFSRVQLCATPWTAAHQAPLSLGFSRQEHWSGLPFPSPIHESEKWNWSRSVVSDPQRPRGLQPSRLLHPWDFPGKSTGVGCHCLLQF